MSALKPTNEPYAIGIKLCECYNRQHGTTHGIDYRSVMPTNLYEPGDNYHPENSHVISALIRRFHGAKVAIVPYVTVWGSGILKREFLYVDEGRRRPERSQAICAAQESRLSGQLGHES